MSVGGLGGLGGFIPDMDVPPSGSASGADPAETGVAASILSAIGWRSSSEPVSLRYTANDGGLDTQLWSAFTGQPRGPQTLEEYVARAELDAGGRPIGVLEFTGHGGPGFQKIGPDGPRDANGRTPGVLEVPLGSEEKAALARLGRLMPPDGTIVLGGCDVASSDKGIALMHEIAKATGRKVVAGDVLQLPTPGVEGNVHTVYPDGRHDHTRSALGDAYGTVTEEARRIIP